MVLAPLFEEQLYRGLVLESTFRAWGAGAAVVASSTLFALPHALGHDVTTGSWRVLGTFCAGVVLALLQLAHRRLSASVGAHAGFNLAAVLHA